MDSIKNRLFEMQDSKYRDFHCRLMPNIEKERVIGIRTPRLRAYAKEISGTPEAWAFLAELSHKYYDENNLHAFLIAEIKDFDECVAAVNEFLPYVDNWATCDMLRPKCFKKHKERLFAEIKRWISSEHTYTVRFGIEMLMCFYLDDDFDRAYLDMAAKIKSDEYYVNMMIAWFFATALAKQYDAAVGYIEKNRLPDWVHNKTVQKATESLRITTEQKEYLKSMKK